MNTTDEPTSVAVAALQKTDITEHEVPVDTYPPISSIKETSLDRLIQAAKDDSSTPTETVLYLAYGSNMSAQTFLGMRGIRPLSELNVAVPSLRLTFDLPGIAYKEPCFANVEYREDHDGKLPTRDEVENSWDGSLMGIVYEVTQKDWAHIMATEGGGSSYQEIIVPCVPLPNSGSKAEQDAIPTGIKARTLYAPRLPSGKNPRNRSWWERLTTGPYRPQNDYAQASLRYLSLLRTGAVEHNLPQVYKDYLNNLQPFTATTRMQKIGTVAFMLAWGPAILALVKGTAPFADEQGRLPKALATLVTIAFNGAWISYDHFYKPIFGEGEKTQPVDDKKDEEGAAYEKESLLE